MQSIREEFNNRINSAIRGKRHSEPGDIKGSEIVIIVPVPDSFAIDCEDVSGIDLDGAVISVCGGKSVTDTQGNVLLDKADVKRMNAALYKVRGFIPK